MTPKMVLAAFRKVPLPASTLQLWPRHGATLVNLPTIVATEAEAFDTTVHLLGKAVTLHITPTSYTWQWGDQQSTTTDTPGVAFDPDLAMSSYITHTYARPGHLQVAVDTTWSATYRVGNGPSQPVNGTVTINGTPAPLHVRTATPTLTNPGT